MRTIDRDIVKDWNPLGVEAIARDRIINGTPAERARWTKVYEALRVVAEADAEIGEWIACLRCGLAFPTLSEQNDHGRIHRR